MHRDFKPENVMIDEDLKVKVVSKKTITGQIDFGDAKEFGEEVYNEQSKEGPNAPGSSYDNTNHDPDDRFASAASEAVSRKDTFVGTPLYVSPEMLEHSVSVPASDLWALGCMIFKMHTGRNAFQGFTEH